MARWSLLIVTERYPFPGGDSAFVGDEIEILARHFDRIVVAPQKAMGVPEQMPIRTELFLGLAKDLRRAESLPWGFIALIKEIPSALFSGEKRPARRHLDVLDFGKLLHYLRKARISRRSLLPVLERLRDEKVIVYTFWLNAVTYGLSQLKPTFPDMRLISRSHGADLYLERHRHGFIPFRARTLRELDALCLVADSTRGYMSVKYPTIVDRFHTFGLGTPDYAIGKAFQKDAGNRKLIYLVSCSSLSQVKRVDRIIDALAVLGSKILTGIVWVHFGGGTLERELEEQARERLVGIQYRFAGRTEKTKILEFYRNNDIAGFISASESEGGRPVSIMEALCFGIPIVAPNVGGIPEIVNDKNGILYVPEADPVEISQAILRILNDPDPVFRRNEARKTWESICQAEKNYTDFAEFLLGLYTKQGGE